MIFLKIKSTNHISFLLKTSESLQGGLITRFPRSMLQRYYTVCFLTVLPVVVSFPPFCYEPTQALECTCFFIKLTWITSWLCFFLHCWEGGYSKLRLNISRGCTISYLCIEVMYIVNGLKLIINSMNIYQEPISCQLLLGDEDIKMDKTWIQTIGIS